MCSSVKVVFWCLNTKKNLNIKNVYFYGDFFSLRSLFLHSSVFSSFYILFVWIFVCLHIPEYRDHYDIAKKTVNDGFWLFYSFFLVFSQFAQ